MEICPNKTKVMTNNSKGFQREIKIKGQRLEAIENVKYLGPILSNEGSKPEVLSRTAQVASTLSRLNIIWRAKNISLASKVNLVRTLILCTFFFACDSWTLTAELKRKSNSLRWDAIGDFWTFPTKTIWRTRRFAAESGMQLDTMIKKRKIKCEDRLAIKFLHTTVKEARRRWR